MTAALVTFKVTLVHPAGLVIAGILLAAGVLTVALEWVPAGCRGAWKGVRALNARLRPKAREWWQREDAGLPERLAVPSILDQTIPRVIAAGPAPWDPDAPSLTTGAGLYDLKELQRLIGRDAS